MFRKILKKISQPVAPVFKELKLVEWISLKLTIQYTLLVLVISIMVGIIIIAFDVLFFQGRNVLLDL